MKIRNGSILLSSCALAVLAMPAMAQTEGAQASEAVADQSADQAEGIDALGEITVTARRREEDVQTVPVAVTVLDSGSLEASGNFTPAQLTTAAPSVIVTPFNGDRSNIILTIRGQAYSTGSLFPAVYAYFSEVPLTKLTTGNFYDIENIQVLRGPQGTLFGRVTDGGNVLIQPRRPSNEFGGYIEARVGNYDLRAATGALNVPIIDGKLMVRGAFEINRRDGFSRSLTTGQRFDDVRYESARFSVLLSPVESIENYTTLNYNHADESGGSAVLQFVNRAAVVNSATSALGAAGANARADAMVAEWRAQQARSPYLTTSDTLSLDQRDVFWLTNKTEWEMSDNITSKLILGYVRYKQKVQADSDGTYLPFSANLAVLPTSLNNQRQLTGEFQLQGNGFDRKLNWTLGTYVDKQETAGPSESYSMSQGVQRRVTVQSVKTTSTAFYGQASYEVLTGVTAEGGIRYTIDTSAADTANYVSTITVAPDPTPHGQCLTSFPAGVSPTTSQPCTPSDAKFKETTYLASAQWQATDDVFLYAKFSKGYRPGGFNATRVASAYGPEKLFSKEIGIKSSFELGGVPVRLNVAGFYDDLKNQQRFTTFRDGSVSSSGVINGKSAEIRGIEVDLEVVPMTGLNLSLDYSYLKASYDPSEYTAAELTAACPADPMTQVPNTSLFCPYGQFARVPENMFTFSARYAVPIDPGLGKLTVGGSWYHTDKQWSIGTSYINPNVLVPAYDIVNADITWKDVGESGMDLAVFATNLLDNQYLQSVSSGSYMGGSGIGFAMYGEPRMYGVRVRYNF